MNTQQNSRVPLHVRQYYRDETRPVKIFNQHFGNGVFPDDFTSTLPVRQPFQGRRYGYGRKETGVSELRIETDRFFVLLDLKNFSQGDVTVRTFDGYLHIEANHDQREDEHGLVQRCLVRKYYIPEGVDVEQLNGYFTIDGVLFISGPKQVTCEQQPSRLDERRISITQTGQPSANLQQQQQQFTKKK